MQFEKRKKDYLLGRYSAKMALSVLSGETELDKIFIEQGVFNHPVVLGTCQVQSLEVAITHCDDLGAAAAFPRAYPLGIDLERVSTDRIRVMEKETTGEEKKILKDLPFSKAVSLASFWTAKEALSKVLKTGLTTPFHIYEINRVEGHEGYLISHYKYFTQYCCFSFDWGGYVFSMACPRETELPVEFISHLQELSFVLPGTRDEAVN
jgi:phosphopantetheinyl transferase (holo-ACP synthase)